MFRIESAATINMPLNECWEKLRDLSLAANYVPGLIRCELSTAQTEGVGASRRVYQKSLALDETVTDWREGNGFTIRLHDGEKAPPMFKEGYFIYQLEDSGNGTTTFRPAMEITMPWGVIGSLLGKLLQPMMQKTLYDVALAMKIYYETDNKVTPEILKAAKQAEQN